MVNTRKIYFASLTCIFVYTADVWTLNPVTLLWTAVTGSTAFRPTPNPGTFGRASTATTPGPMIGQGTAIDSLNRIYVFG